MGRRVTLWILAGVFLVSTTAHGQGETAVPFLMIPTSVQGNGMGGVAASLVTNDAISDLSNPAQLGMFGLSNSLSLSTYFPKTDWLPNFTSGLSLNASALSAGLRLDKYIDLPVPVSLGIGYSQIYFDLGTFTQTLPNSPTVVNRWHAYEEANLLSVGIGVDYVVKLGLGYSYKWIDSELAPFGTEQMVGPGTAKVPAYDFGAILQIPVVDIISNLGNLSGTSNKGISPLFNLTFGYAERNIGGSVNYVVQAQSDPLPRQGVLGWNFELGLKTAVDHRPWKLLSFTWAREAEDVLVSVKTLETVVAPGDTAYTNQFAYKSGLGSIRPIDNLVLGRTYGEIALQKGWEIGIAECLYFRGGSNTDVGGLLYDTRGEAISLNGFLKLFAALGIWNPRDGWGAYLRNHVDLQYNSCTYTSTTNELITGTKFSSINIVFR